MNAQSFSAVISRISFSLFLAISCAFPALGQSVNSDYPIPMDDPHSRATFEYSRLANPATGKIPHDIRAKELAFSKTIPNRPTAAMLKQLSPAKIATQQWTFRGPDQIGGRSRALGIDQNNTNIMLAGGISGGMWRSMDAGASWVRVTPLDEIQSVSCLDQDPRSGKTNIWYYGTGEYIGNSASARGATYWGNGIFKSTDNGITWTQLPETNTSEIQTFSPFRYVWRVAVDPSRNDSDVVYAATIGGIYRSNDGGTTWNLALGGGDRWSTGTDIAISSKGEIYATLGSYAITSSGGSTGSSASTRGIFRSTDGLEWTNIGSGHFPTAARRIVLDIAPSDENIVYFLGETPGSGFQSIDPSGNSEYHSLYKYTYTSGDGSGDNGVWEERSTSLPYYNNLGPWSSQGSYDLVVRVKPDDPDFVILGGTNLYRSTNGFKTPAANSWIGGYNPDYDPSGANLLIWINLSYSHHHPDIHDVVFHPTDYNIMYTADDGGIHQTTECKKAFVDWREMNNGFLTSQFYAISIHPTKDGDQTIIGGMQDNSTYGQTAPNEEWLWLSGGDGCYCAVQPNADNTYYVSSQYGRLYKTVTDADMYVNEITSLSVPNVNRYTFPFVAPFQLDPSDPNALYIAAGDVIYRNPRLDDMFVELQWETMDGTAPSSGSISAIAVSTNPASTLFFGTSRGRLYMLENAKTTYDDAVQITDAIFPVPGNISCIAVDPQDANVRMVVFSNYGIRSLFYTSDGGTTWNDVSGNLEEDPSGSGNGPSCRWADMIRTGGQTIWFVGTSTGLYSTTELNGASTVWHKEGTNSIGDAVVTMIRTRQSDGFVAVATHGNGIFSTFATPVGISGGDAIPPSFYLEQNFPNPVSDNTTIQYSVPSAASYSITVHDALGRIVQTVHAGAGSPGVFNATIDAGGLPAGNYFIRLTSDGYCQTRMMTVK